ncbi:MAG: hypothetical protein D8H98_18455 [Prevotella sp.]|nr:MAG: hypothetical protein D8H98_18455 [Prevotella sp.]
MIIFRIFVNMKKYVFIIQILFIAVACEQNQGSKAIQMLENIETYYNKGDYKRALDSISALRVKYPSAIEERKKALVIWQKASLKQAEQEIVKTDSALQNIPSRIASAKTLLQKNLLGVKRDSLKARYDAMCSVVRMIRIRMKEEICKE